MAKSKAMEVVPDVVVTIMFKGSMVAAAAISPGPLAAEDVDVVVGCSDPDQVEEVVECLELAVRALRDADWQLVLGFSHEGDEDPEEAPF